MSTAPAAPTRPAPLPCFAPVDFLPLGDGTFKAVPRKPVQVASISTAVKLTGLARQTLWRLYRTKFIKGTQPSPKKILIDMASLYAHIEATKDEEFWTRERRQRFDDFR